jgi:hypothetical protein
LIRIIAETSNYLEKLKSTFQSRIIECVLSKTTVLKKGSSVFGSYINVIHVYGDFYLLSKLKLNCFENDVALAVPVNLYYALIRYLAKLGIEFEYTGLDKKDVEEWVQNKFNCSSKLASKIYKSFKGNVYKINRSEDVLYDILAGRKPAKMLVDNPPGSYREVVLYLCGDPDTVKETFITTLYKYRQSGRHIIKFIRDVLKIYMEIYYSEGEYNSSRIPAQILEMCYRISEISSIENVTKLYYSLRGCICDDLLIGVI